MELIKFLRGQAVFIIMTLSSILILIAIDAGNPVLMIQFSSWILFIIAILTNQGKIFAVGFLLNLIFYI